MSEQMINIVVKKEDAKTGKGKKSKVSISYLKAEGS